MHRCPRAPVQSHIRAACSATLKNWQQLLVSPPNLPGEHEDIDLCTYNDSGKDKQTAGATHAQSQNTSSHIPNHNPQGGGPETQRENRRLCGCSNVYVLQISNDERIPFHVWTGRARVHTPRLNATHTLPAPCE